MSRRFKTFNEFYPFYLSEHRNPMCRLLHFIGVFGIIFLILVSLLFLNRIWIYAPFLGYSLAWLGHFIFERNRPATFKYPIYSLIGDFLMFYHLLIGKEKFNSPR